MTEVKALSHGRVVRLRVRQGFCCLGLGLFAIYIVARKPSWEHSVDGFWDDRFHDASL